MRLDTAMMRPILTRLARGDAEDTTLLLPTDVMKWCYVGFIAAHATYVASYCQRERR